MSRWFRSYDDALDDPKVQSLPDPLFKAWYNLLCVTSKNDGQPFTADEVAFRLRVKLPRARVIIAELLQRELLDAIGDRYVSHNWDARQYKSDVSNERVKRHRERKCNVTSNVTETPPETEQNRTEADAEDARARPPLIRPEALTLADDIALLCGHDLKFLPPGFCGAAMRVESWLAHGWQREMILAAVAGVLAKRSGKAPDSVNYFEKPIAEFIAKAARPLPEVVIDNTPEKVHVRAETNSAVAGADRVLARMQEFDQPAGGGDGSQNNVRLLSQG
jgi:hypothetical protein